MRLRGFFFLLSLMLMGFSLAGRAQPAGAPLPAGMRQPVYLWPNGVPGALGHAEADIPRLYPFLPGTRSTSTAVLVIPGGGYEHVAMGYEGVQIAGWLNAQGIPAFVLDYRVKPYHYPAEIEDGQRAMRLIRAHAAEYGIDPQRLGVWGSSAGGHLASTLGTHCDADAVPMEKPDTVDRESCKPAFMVLAYPVVSMVLPEAHAGSRTNLLGPEVNPALEKRYSNQFAVTAETPMTFLFATTRDPIVPVENTLDFYRALERAKVPAELHIYDYANHGCGLCGSILPLSTWPALLRNWLVQRGWVPSTAPPPPPPQPNLPAWIPGLTGPGKAE
jgi:acetyl esterase/lipase